MPKFCAPMWKTMFVASLFAGLCQPGLSLAGPLDPPAGPIASTGKVIGEIEPRIAINDTNTPGDANSRYRIAARGSYYLTGNIQGAASKSGIEIGASDVTIDLNGFALIGVPSSLSGITTDGSQTRITIRNGSIVDWDGSGITSVGSGSAFFRVEDVSVDLNASQGISLPNNSSAINCSANGNTGNGITILTFGTIRGCMVANNGTGISAGQGSVINQCSSSSNAGHGFSTPTSATLADCIAYDNGGTGFNGGNSISAQGCVSRANNIGFDFLAGGAMTNCTAFSNATIGIRIASSTAVTNCSATSNTSHGFDVGSGCNVTDCTAQANGGSGFRMNGTRSRLEGNISITNDRGYDAVGAGNVIVRNTASANTTNWALVANNVFGPIFDRSAVVSGAVSGNSAVSSLGTTDANANFTH